MGHAVRTAYMLSSMADIAALTGDADYLRAVDRIWENVVGKKMHLTGGIGTSPNGEAFGANYDLPNRTAYLETCAAIANGLWNHRIMEAAYKSARTGKPGPIQFRRSRRRLSR